MDASLTLLLPVASATIGSLLVKVGKIVEARSYNGVAVSFITKVGFAYEPSSHPIQMPTPANEKFIAAFMADRDAEGDDGVILELLPNPDGTVKVERIHTCPPKLRRQGGATKWLSRLCSAADRDEIVLVCELQAYSEHQEDDELLMFWLGARGFTVDDPQASCRSMTRKPKHMGAAGFWRDEEDQAYKIDRYPYIGNTEVFHVYTEDRRGRTVWQATTDSLLADLNAKKWNDEFWRECGDPSGGWKTYVLCADGSKRWLPTVVREL